MNLYRLIYNFEAIKPEDEKMLSNSIQSYLDHCKNTKKLKKLTLKAYSIDLQQFLLYMREQHKKDIFIAELNKAMLVPYVNFISEKYKAKTLKRKIASLKAFFNHLEYEDIIDVSPFRKIKCVIKEPRSLPKSLSLFDMEKIITYLYHNFFKDKKSTHIRNIAIFEVLFATGMRVSELCNLAVKDYDPSSQTLFIQGKGNKERLVFISNKYVLAALNNYINLRPDTTLPYLFINRLGNRLSEQSVRYFIKNLGDKVLNKYVTPHMIRHTFATLMLEEGVDIKYIQNFLGHSSITTTQIYTYATVVKQKQIMLLFHPRNRILISE